MRLQRIKDFLNGYAFQPEALELILRAYNDYTNHGVYPYAGGAFAQPVWVIRAFDILAAAGEAIKLDGKRVNVVGLPGFESVLGVPPSE